MPLGIAPSAEGVVRPQGGQMSSASATKPQCFLDEINPVINHPQDRDGVSNRVHHGTSWYIMVHHGPHVLFAGYYDSNRDGFMASHPHFCNHGSHGSVSVCAWRPTPNRIGSGAPHGRSPVSAASVFTSQLDLRMMEDVAEVCKFSHHRLETAQ